MLTILLGEDWISNRNAIFDRIARDVRAEKSGRVLIVPELISHDAERRLCQCAGDTASRFAEVLPFTRLYRRVSEFCAQATAQCLDNGGRVVAMASATRQLHSKLKAYASVETKPEFLTGLIDAIDEFKRCCIRAEDLSFAAKQSEGALAQKLEELSLIYETYDALCTQGKRDPSDQMTWLLEQLEDSDFAQNHVFYIDGFPDFTRQHMAILQHLILSSEEVVISLNCDKLDSDSPAFEKAGETAGALVRFAKKNGVEYKISLVSGRDDPLQNVRKNLFRGKICQDDGISAVLSVQQFSSIQEEVLAAAERIKRHICEGGRYRQIGVVCSDINTYRNSVEMIFDRCGLPFYLSGTEDILDKPVLTTVLSAMQAALEGFEHGDVMRYAKSMLSPLDVDLSDRLENYTIMWNIQGNRWFDDWTYHPDGLDAGWTDKAKSDLQLINSARQRIILPLQRLRKGFAESGSVADQVRHLYAFFCDIDLPGRLLTLSKEFEALQDYRNAQILEQLWDILLSAMEQMYDVLGNTAWDGDTFARLFRLLLSQYDVGTIPTVLDSVMVGPVSAMRCHEFDHLIILGALEGQLPGYGGSSGVLTDQERVAIRRLGVPLTGGAMEGVTAEFAEIYGVFCSAQKSVSIFAPGGQPSYLFRRLYEMCGAFDQVDTTLTYAKCDPHEACAFLARMDAEDSAATLGLQDRYSSLRERIDHTLGSVEREHIEKLYGKQLYLSASQIDKQADCRLSYFMKYGLRAKERKTITIDPAEFGTYVHFVLEKTARDVKERGGFHKVTLDETLAVARNHSADYVQERFSQLDSRRVAYFFQRNAAELDLVVRDLWDELHISDFEPVEFEVAFGDNATIDAIDVPGSSMAARLRGFVDRVDAWQTNGQRYYRVVDYKTGRKDFDYCDVFNGYGLQMLLYLFALKESGQVLLGDDPVPAGVQYFPARVPVISADGILPEDAATVLREKSQKRSGLLLHNEHVLHAMEPVENPVKTNYTKKKDGTLTGDLATPKQMGLLKGYIFALLAKMVDEIASGYVDANPYTRGNSHNACAFCPYGAVCHPDTVEGRRNYKTMSSQRFWEEIEKEMNSYG